MDPQKPTYMLAGNRGLPVIPTAIGGDIDLQSKLSRETGCISECWAWLRDPISMNKGDEPGKIILNTNLKLPHTHTCMQTYMHTNTQIGKAKQRILGNS